MQIDNSNKDNNEMTLARVGRITPILTLKRPSVLPFKGTFPLVPELEYKVFLEETLKQEYFDDLPKFIKEITYKAEQVREYDDLFREYLNRKDISIKEFVLKNPKTKQDLLFDWLFSSQLDEGVLEL